MRKEITITELDTETVELLPSRETLHVRINLAKVFALNAAHATNFWSYGATAAASAKQSIAVVQG
jgi:hypothetical protein